jgi:hypothetical protein
MRVKIKETIAYPKNVSEVEFAITGDNAQTESNITFALFGTDGTVTFSGSLKIDGETYTSWNGSNDTLKTIVLGKLGLVEEITAPEETME